MTKDDKKYNKGIELLRAEKYLEALEIFNQLINDFPQEADYWSERGVVHFHLNKKKESLADMDKAVDLQTHKSYRYSWYRK